MQNDPDHKKPKEIAEEVKILTDLPAADRRETMTADGQKTARSTMEEW